VTELCQRRRLRAPLSGIPATKAVSQKWADLPLMQKEIGAVRFFLN